MQHTFGGWWLSETFGRWCRCSTGHWGSLKCFTICSLCPFPADIVAFYHFLCRCFLLMSRWGACLRDLSHVRRQPPVDVEPRLEREERYMFLDFLASAERSQFPDDGVHGPPRGRLHTLQEISEEILIHWTVRPVTGRRYTCNNRT